MMEGLNVDQPRREEKTFRGVRVDDNAPLAAAAGWLDRKLESFMDSVSM